ncbi:MAG: hypothetical protein BLM47_05090 [Candidatus Reconcilbacillus cellulovorans]|mgnify:CR=1 FL=1|uniref:Uncharacterized protein n=1 Tax=Candidatus Reconcilbacillus cellulovorans TaxID=1906605 RepID=A0A2A6E239_9BACL|nr:MAG: hypothetical protein BLM47_05090 [Candidatus Reconcilbacillus cellulovorans]
MRGGDIYVVWGILIGLGIWAYFGLKRRLSDASEHPVPTDEEPAVSDETALGLLREHGYEIVAGKRKVPIHIDAGGQSLSSRLFIDAVARKDDETFVVRIARPRKPMEWTGSSVRDHLLVYALLYDDADGVLYVDPESRTVRTVRFELDR